LKYTYSIAAAQSWSVKGNIEENIRIHKEYIKVALQANVDLLVFPELSLTGYEPELAKELANKFNFEMLEEIMELIEKSELTVALGCPISSGETKPYLTSLILRPNMEIIKYRKRFLSNSEGNYFLSSNNIAVMDAENEKIGFAICSDTSNYIHPKAARELGSTIYAVSSLIDDVSISSTWETLSKYAAVYHMAVILSNHAQDTGAYKTAGKSAIWDNNGNLITAFNGVEKGILIARKKAIRWIGEQILV